MTLNFLSDTTKRNLARATIGLLVLGVIVLDRNIRTQRYEQGQLDMCNKLFAAITGDLFTCVNSKQGVLLASPLAPGKTVPLNEFLSAVGK